MYHRGTGPCVLVAPEIPGITPTVAHFAERAEGLGTLPHVGDVRRYGLALGVELVADRERRTPYPPAERMGMRVCRAATARGVFLRPIGDTVIVMPALTMPVEELDLLFDTLTAAIGEACG